MGFPGGSGVKNSPGNAGDGGLRSGSGRSPGKGHDDPLQHSCLKIPWSEEPGGHRVPESQPRLTSEHSHRSHKEIIGDVHFYLWLLSTLVTSERLSHWIL